MAISDPKILTEITRGFSATLKFLAALGYPGVECSEQTLERINAWGVMSPEKPSSAFGKPIAFPKCRECALSSSAQPMVQGAGPVDARLVIVGGAASPEDLAAGIPYAGPAGKLLDKMLEAMGLSRAQVYITRAVKCCPPDGRNPSLTDVHVCRSHLLKELGTVKPKIVCAFGDIAAMALLETSVPLSRLRGRFHDVQDAKVMPTHAPEHLLRHPEAKREVWEDLKQIMAALEKN